LLSLHQLPARSFADRMSETQREPRYNCLGHANKLAGSLMIDNSNFSVSQRGSQI
jgi:hypothetical protein